MAIRKTLLAAAALSLVLTQAAGPALAADEDEEDGITGLESRFYGTVEKTPPGGIGTWVVNRRDVVVTRETRIFEKHGKAGTGAYVEVEGNNTGKVFSATRIEVKRSGHQ